MKRIKLIVLILLIAMTTACVVYDPAMYACHPPVVAHQAPGPNGQPDDVYVAPAPAPPPAVVVDPFTWLFGPWLNFGFYYGPYGYYPGPYYGYYRGWYGHGYYGHGYYGHGHYGHYHGGSHGHGSDHH